MKRPLSPWCKAVQKELIDRNMSRSELAEAIGRSKVRTSNVVSGLVYSEPMMKLISDFLNIPDDDYDVPC